MTGADHDVAALYVDTARGPYAQIDGVACWGWARRDGRQRDLFAPTRNAQDYAGPAPVVAHPPCGPWGMFAWNYKGGEGSRECGLRAVEQVRAYGGVLEHPVQSKLWTAAGLPKPSEGRDIYGGRTVRLDQCDWGHRARKPTWIYAVGGVMPRLPPPRRPSHVMVRLLSNGNDRPELPKAERHLTPPAFAAWLVTWARSVRRDA